MVKKKSSKSSVKSSSKLSLNNPAKSAANKNSFNYWNVNPTRNKWKSFKHESNIVYRKEHWMAEEIEESGIKGMKVLDAGCGQGLNLWKMLECGADAHGVDFSVNAVKECRRRLKQAGYSGSRATVGDLQDLSQFPDNHFDVVFSLGVLHHIPSFDKGLKELHRVCKKDGRIIIMVYSKSTIQNFGLRAFRIFGKPLFSLTHADKNKKYGTFWHELLLCPIWNTYTRRDLRKRFAKAGFVDTKFRRTFTGFTRIADFLPTPRFIDRFYYWLDRRTKRVLGFYEMAYARKK